MRDWIEKRDFDGDEKVDFREFLQFRTLLLEQDNTDREEPLSIESYKPPDGGWGWIIVFACFMFNFIIGKFQFSFCGFLSLHRSLQQKYVGSSFLNIACVTIYSILFSWFWLFIWNTS